MSNQDTRLTAAAAIVVDRRASVLSSAFDTFARFGYRKTSMEEVARVARISRPGLYFLFASKDELFRAAVSQALEQDLTEVERILGEPARSLRDRLVASFDRWAGRYIGSLTKDIAGVIDDDPDLLGQLAEEMPQRFAGLITRAIEEESAVNREKSIALAQTLISLSIGIKYQVDEPQTYRDRLTVGIDLLLRVP